MRQQTCGPRAALAAHRVIIGLLVDQSSADPQRASQHRVGQSSAEPWRGASRGVEIPGDPGVARWRRDVLACRGLDRGAIDTQRWQPSQRCQHALLASHFRRQPVADPAFVPAREVIRQHQAADAAEGRHLESRRQLLRTQGEARQVAGDQLRRPLRSAPNPQAERSSCSRIDSDRRRRLTADQRVGSSWFPTWFRLVPGAVAAPRVRFAATARRAA